ncbi:hypothetical protein DFR68_12014 [Nocardia mexicana]|uniref:Uncharacterized protein n=1 Tax=Nocardia mexicana TaxID=279262 RepID=A0A370GIS6_9NOCA|nr:hypothetical protein DFR68_12014 [Nocardia mexicana]
MNTPYAYRPRLPTVIPQATDLEAGIAWPAVHGRCELLARRPATAARVHAGPIQGGRMTAQAAGRGACRTAHAAQRHEAEKIGAGHA